MTSTTEGRREGLAPVPVVLGFLLLLVVVAATALAGSWRFPPADPMTPWDPEATVSEAPIDPPVEPFFTAEDGPLDSPGTKNVLMVVLTIITIAAIGLVVVLLVRWIRGSFLPWLDRQRDRPADPDVDLLVVADAQVHALREATEVARTTLRQSTLAPGDAVVAAWLAMESAAEATGTPRRPAQTPTEFTVAVLADTPATPEPVEVLLGLYHRARFTDGLVTAGDVASAVDALDRIARDLAPRTVDL